MKRLIRIISYLLIGILLLFGGFIAYLQVAFPKDEVKALREVEVQADSATVEWGKYLANVTGGCIHCHSQLDFSYHVPQLIAGTEGSGGQVWTPEQGLPGEFYAPNLTPYHLGSWTDSEVFRAVTAGISKDGGPLFPLMPYHYFGRFDPKDVEAIIAYLRTLEPLARDVPLSRPSFMMKHIMRMMPAAPESVARPEPDDSIALGEYLASISCLDCHTPLKKGRPIVEMAFAGGREFIMPGGEIVTSANLTPHHTGMGGWSAEAFINKFRYYASPEGRFMPVEKAGYHTPMPWTEFSSMKEEELRAIYYYLQNLDPVENAVLKVKTGQTNDPGS